VCAHKDLAKINEAIVAGTSYRTIARQYHLSKDAVQRHGKKHLPTTLVAAKEASEIANANDLFEQVRDLGDRTLRILEKAEKAGKLPVALQAIRVVQNNIELLIRMICAMKEQEKARPEGLLGDLESLTDEELRAITEDSQTHRPLILIRDHASLDLTESELRDNIVYDLQNLTDESLTRVSNRLKALQFKRRRNGTKGSDPDSRE